VNGLVEWSDLSCFKVFCLDRLAAGLPVDVIASDVSSFFGRVVPVEQVVASCSEEEILERRKQLLDEVRASAPLISRDLLSTLGRIKKFLDRAEASFDSSNAFIEDFDAYRRALELQLKAIDVGFSQLGRLNDSVRSPTSIVVSFNFDDLKRLESAGAVKVIDAELAGDLLGSEVKS
jgi:hypothetical protein